LDGIIFREALVDSPASRQKKERGNSIGISWLYETLPAKMLIGLGAKVAISDHSLGYAQKRKKIINIYQGILGQEPMADYHREHVLTERFSGKGLYSCTLICSY